MVFTDDNSAIAPDAVYFITDGKSTWQELTGAALLTRLESNPPVYRTILGITRRPDDDSKRDGWAYIGPWYLDIDAEDLHEAAGAFHKLMDKLQGQGVDLDQVRLAATGGRGFHIEVPQACFMATVPHGGTENLNDIYREMALAVVVDGLDMRIYSGRRGRAWRVANVRRDNGLYKVPLSVAEALAITSETYADLCSAPRPFPPLRAPTLAPGLATLFANSRNKVTTKKSRKRASSNLAESMKQRFTSRGAPLPPSLLGLAAGQIPAREGVGFNQIALQLSVTAVAMGTSEDQLIALCQGIIQHHQGDGDRYGTPRKRERALRQMYGYVEGAPYDVSVGGIRAILPADVRCNDLRGL